MDFEKKDDIDTKEILDDMNSDVQVKKSKLPIILFALLYGTALYGFVFSIIANNRLGESSTVVVFALFIMIFVVMILQIRGVLSAAKIEDIDYCLNTYFLYKYKILEKRYGIGYFDSCIQLYYNGHISVYIFGNKVFWAVILWN